MIYRPQNFGDERQGKKETKALKLTSPHRINFMAWLSAIASSFAWQMLARRCLRGFSLSWLEASIYTMFFGFNNIRSVKVNRIIT